MTPLSLPQPGGDSDDAGDQVGETKAQLDADGKLAITLPTPVSEHKYDFVYRIEARVTDQANREITGRGHVIGDLRKLRGECRTAALFLCARG